MTKKTIIMAVILVLLLGVAGFLYKDMLLGMFGLSQNQEEFIEFNEISQPQELQTTSNQTTLNDNEISNTKVDNTQNQKETLKNSCENGNVDDCINLALKYIESKDFLSAIKVVIVPCERKNAKSCAILADIYSGVDGVEKSIPLFIAYATRACDYGDVDSCYSLGVKYYRGVDLKEDIKKSFDLFKKSCDNGKVEGCNNLAVIYNNGANGISKNTKLAKDIFKKACDNGYKPSCKNLSKIN
ncbi:tetratricopeptide repeat protein [Helicobacter sp. MIT 14-3879]|uniref:tetratricopeptide repeat protein n=1 Tax=Helicobacter sp. MIT 14-3879 TaxID=2040649 RepID=UPI000E1E8043|nr:tetratricopeptide repeat protein [Helicobacter sp. MIT 14-3879]RDU64803.1 hypothetical protein CQA44_03585 [Helicobacter sp. MIT 14-3879]